MKNEARSFLTSINRRIFVQHINRLLGCGVISVFKPESFDDPPCLDFVGVEFEELGNRDGLLRRQQSLSQLYLAQMRLVHFRSGSDDSKRQFLAFA